MSEDKVEVIRAVFEAFNRRDWETWRSHHQPDVEWSDAPGFPGGGTRRGADEVLGFMGEALETMDEWQVEVEAVESVGDGRVLMRGRSVIVGRASGISMDEPLFQLFEFEGGQVSRVQAFRSNEEALEAAGPSNEDLVRRGTVAFNDRDIERFLETCDREIEFTTRIMELEGGGPHRGHNDVRRWWKEVFAVFPDFRIEVDDVQDLGGVTVTRLLQSGQGAGSSAPTERTSWQVTEWRAGKAVWMKIFQSEDEALAAAEARR